MAITCLVDGNAVAYTINLKNCSSEQDFIRTFFMRLREYAKDFPSMPKFLLFFDDKRDNWRDEIYPEYQKKRKEGKYVSENQAKENELRSSYVRKIKEKIDKSNKYKYIHFPHTETDDLIALYCNNVQKENETVVILTTDKDLFQLIEDKGNKKVQVLFLIKRKLIKDSSVGRDILEQKIYLGDPSDSIPGVCKNVGPANFNDFKIFLSKMKEMGIDSFSDVAETKKICEAHNIRYIPSFSNFSKEQLNLNTKLIDLKYVIELDSKMDNIKTNYLKETVEAAKFSPFAIYSLI